MNQVYTSEGKALVLAQDFELCDTREQTIRLSDYRGKKNVVLVLMRGFS